MDLIQWPSLAPLHGVARSLNAAHAAQECATWFEQQMAWVEDAGFAQGFAAHFDLPNVVAGDFNHRIVEGRAGALLGGIRFFGGDVRCPFVEVIAHCFEDDPAALADVVAAEWAAFAPLHMRVLLVPEMHQGFLGRGVELILDQTVHAARFGDMSKPTEEVTLAEVADVEAAIEMVQQRYRDVAVAQPELARLIAPQDPEELRALSAAGQMKRIVVQGQTVGLLAIAPGEVAFLRGQVIEEEVVITTAKGRGYAAAAQVRWAAQGPAEDLMLGTIDGRNMASRRSALRAGRPDVLHYCFVPLT